MSNNEARELTYTLAEALAIAVPGDVLIAATAVAQLAKDGLWNCGWSRPHAHNMEVMADWHTFIHNGDVYSIAPEQPEPADVCTDPDCEYCVARAPEPAADTLAVKVVETRRHEPRFDIDTDLLVEPDAPAQDAPDSEHGAVHEAYRAYMSEVHQMYPELGAFDPCDGLHAGDLVEKHILKPLCWLLGCYSGGTRTIPQRPAPAQDAPSIAVLWELAQDMAEQLRTLTAETDAMRQNVYRGLAEHLVAIRTLQQAVEQLQGGKGEALQQAAPQGEPTLRGRLLAEIEAERARQDERWGGYRHDREHTVGEWIGFIHEYADKAAKLLTWEDTRYRLIQVAALAVAAIESNAKLSIAQPEKWQPAAHIAKLPPAPGSTEEAK